MWAAASVIGLLIGGAVACAQTPGVPQAPRLAQAPTAPEAPTLAQAPNWPQAPTDPQAPTAPEAPTAPQAPMAPVAAMPPPVFSPAPQPYAPIAATVAPTPMGEAQAPASLNATNPLALARLSDSSISSGIPSPNQSVADNPRLVAAGGAPPTVAPGHGGLGWLWLLSIAASLGVTFFFARKIWMDRGAPPSIDTE